MITKGEFLEKYHISEAEFREAEISWDDLCEIYKDYLEHKQTKYKAIRDDFFDTYLKDMNEGKSEAERIKVHTISTRIKDPEHLLEALKQDVSTDEDADKNTVMEIKVKEMGTLNTCADCLDSVLNE